MGAKQSIRHATDCHTRGGGYPVRRGLSVQSLLPLGYWVARSSRAMTKNVCRHSRGADSARGLKLIRPKRREGAGNAGCLLHPRSRVQRVCEETHTSIQVQSEQSGIPCAVVLRLIPCSPRRRIPLASVADGLAVHRNPVGFRKTSAGLTPATGARTTRLCRTQPPVFAKGLAGHWRLSSARCARSRSKSPPCEHAHAPDAAASTASRPNVRDDGQRPSSRDRTAEISG